MGMNLKKYIEHLLIQEAEEMDDAEVYRYLLSTRPEGKVMLTETEQDEFERKMCIGRNPATLPNIRRQTADRRLLSI